MKGLIFSYRRYSIHDGPGIRVTFFMKGCPLSCWWCHNPEGISPDPETVEVVEKVGEMEFRKTEEAGKYYSVEDILEILEKDKIFISESKGGVTFSGGEPMLQTEFLTEALKTCRENGYNTAVDTSGYSTADNFKALIPYTDLFLFDLKHLDNEKHIQFTGVSNSLIISNLKLLIESGKDIMIRIPVIPGFNDDAENSDMLKETGSSKYVKFNIPNRMADITTPSPDRMNELKKFFGETGIKVKIGG
jgi:pyruvate formate lyase activating enzyme